MGDFKNAGREWRPKGRPEKVRVHDFMIEELGKVSPYGVYDLTRNQGWVSVGISHDTAAFAVASIGRWWRHMGKTAYPKSKSLLVTADGSARIESAPSAPVAWPSSTAPDAWRVKAWIAPVCGCG